MSFFTVVTTLGQSKVAQAVSNSLTVELTEIAVGDGNGGAITPLASMTDLVNEVYRDLIPVGGVYVDSENPNWMAFELTIPVAEGGFTVREVGLFDVEGDLFAIGSFPETYKPLTSEGASRELTLTMYVEVSDTSVIELTANPENTVTQSYVDQLLLNHEQSGDHPDASTEERGFVRFATDEEAKSGESTELAVTPAGASALADEKLQAKEQSSRARQFFLGQS